MQLLRIVVQLFLVSNVWFLFSTNAQAQGGPYQIFLPIVSKAFCNYTIGTKIETANGWQMYGNVKPGDTVCIRGGYRETLTLKNFVGTPDRPIKFINYGGQVLFNGTSDFAIRLQNSRYIQLTGTGDTDLQYGIKVDGNYTSGIRVNFKSSDFEIDHVEIRNVSGPGILAKTDAGCPNGSDNSYDYDNDGQVQADLDDIVNQQNFTQYNSIFHDNYISNTGTEGFYIGSSHFGEGSNLNCGNSQTTVSDPLLKSVHIYNNIVENTGWDGIQVGSAVEDCEIHHNRVYRDSQLNKDSQRSGIGANRGSVCNIYSNFIKESASKSIRTYVYGNAKIFNNIIVNPGQKDGPNGDGIWVLRDEGVAGKSLLISNNTIINPSANGISFGFPLASNSRIQNNIIINPGNFGTVGNEAYIKVSTPSNVIVSNNFTTLNINEIKFTNPSADDYSLLPDSPVIDAGANLNDEGIVLDFIGTPRPQGISLDIGAYEFR